MLLTEYPLTISTLELRILCISKEIETLQNQAKNIEGDVDVRIGENLELKNDTQRKGFRSNALQANKTYSHLLQSLNIQEGQKREAEIHHRRMVNEFTVAKLEMQMAIAKMNQMSA